MNLYDSERIAESLIAAGHIPAASPDSADLVILNTCHIREKATEKLFSELGRWRQRKQARGGEMTIAVAGCVAQAEGAEIIRRQSAVDMVIGPQSWHLLPEMLEAGSGADKTRLDFEPEQKFSALNRPRTKKQPAALLSIQEGCDKFCTFCVVPYTRGAEISRPVADIVTETQKLVENGTKELTLLGQNVNAWTGSGADGQAWRLGQLLRHLAGISGLERLRYTTSHPRDMDDDLINAHVDTEKLAPYLHLPAQSGSDKILKAMNRRHRASDYLEIIAKVRQACPEMAFSSDFIVGFPGESENDFEETMALVRETGYASAYSFKYSPRPGTPGAEMPDQIDPDIAADRLARLQALLIEQRQSFNAASIGRRIRVLLTGPGRRKGQACGRSEHMQAVHVEAEPEYIGQFVHIDVLAASANSLIGKLVRKEAV